jgi:hypothetical protein
MVGGGFGTVAPLSVPWLTWLDFAARLGKATADADSTPAMTVNAIAVPLRDLIFMAQSPSVDEVRIHFNGRRDRPLPQ